MENPAHINLNIPSKYMLVVSTDTSIVKMDSMMEHFDNGVNKWKFVVCGKESTQKSNMRSNIETHIKGLSNPCYKCTMYLDPLWECTVLS